MSDIENILTESKDKGFDAVTVIGLTKEGGLDIKSSLNNVALMHWMLNKSIFQVNLFENSAPAEEKKEEA